MKLTGDDGGPIAYDLDEIHRAALADPDCRHDFQGSDTPASRRWFTPRRFLKRWPHLVSAYERTPAGHLMVDLSAALEFCKRRDTRISRTLIHVAIALRQEAARVDPIGNAVSSARGGGLAMMLARLDAVKAGWEDDAAFYAAVMDRAKALAATMDTFAAERLMSDIRRAIEGGPQIRAVN